MNRRRPPDFIGIGSAKCGTTWAWRQIRAHPQMNFSYFKKVKGNCLCGEWSLCYLQVPHAAQIIKDHMPNAKLVTIFRNPVDRAWSNFKHLKHICRSQSIAGWGGSLADGSVTFNNVMTVVGGGVNFGTSQTCVLVDCVKNTKDEDKDKN